MRKHSVRKWLHAILDLLPVMILPIFAIWEINHKDNENVSVDVSRDVVVDFNQLTQNGNFADNDYWHNANANAGSYTITNNYLNFSTVGNGGYPGFNQQIPCTVGHYYLVRFDFTGNTSVFLNWGGHNSAFANSLVPNDFYSLSKRILCTSSQPLFSLFFNNPQTSFSATFSNVNVFDLTTMFGAGKEPTLSVFNDYYTANFYPYDVGGVKSLAVGFENITYSDTDVGSQMMYSLYKPIKNYFNFNNVFNFGDIYSWLEFNLFGGSAPMPIFIVWNIIVYEFLMDMIFLLYSVLMFVIDFATDVIDRFLTWSKKGGN